MGLKPLPDFVRGFDHSSTTWVTTDITPMQETHSLISRDARTNAETVIPKWARKLDKIVFPGVSGYEFPWRGYIDPNIRVMVIDILGEGF